MTKEYLGSGNDDGSVMGRSSGKIGFYGLGTPIVKATITLGAGTTTTLLKADVAAITAALAALGLVTSA
ncbi:MAG: hypothetical protein DRH08_14930 [Deltaproteobacteria bacterium]|nr:MAG: hypothetical protein DRH08_14930 [Deltaproteobacteria bacterium]